MESKKMTERERNVFTSEATNCHKSVVFKVFTAVVMKCSIFWDITLSSQLIANQCREEIYQLNFMIKEQRLTSGFLVWLSLQP
jgi:hypothetical protein